MSRFGRLVAVAFGVMALSQAPDALTQPVPPPPLLPGEVLVPVRDGCLMVLRYTPASGKTQAEWIAQWRTSRWEGQCRNGLVHGRGRLIYNSGGQDYPGEPTDVTYGRFFGASESTNSGGLRVASFTTLDGRGASINYADPMTPVWGAESGRDTLISADGWIATTHSTTCMGEERQFQGCTYENNYKIYGMWVWRTADGGSPPRIWCPDPRTPVGCEALWRERAGPIYANFQAISAEVVRDTPAWRNQLTQLNAPREAQIAAMEVAKREAIAREQAAADEAAAKEEKALQATLTAGNPGQLFALADELRERGETDRARQVLRTLVSRFPNHALATTAAEQLSQMSGSSRPNMAAAPPASSRPAAPTATASYRPPSSGVNEAACKAEVDRLANVLNASQPRNAGNSIRQMETLMFVLKAMADTTDAMCPRTQAYINASAGFRQTYNDTARTCSQVSSQGACTARMH